MGSSWQVSKLLRLRLRSLDPQLLQVRLRGRRATPLPVKAVFDAEGGESDYSRLARLKDTMLTNQAQQYGGGRPRDTMLTNQAQQYGGGRPRDTMLANQTQQYGGGRPRDTMLANQTQQYGGGRPRDTMLANQVQQVGGGRPRDAEQYRPAQANMQQSKKYMRDNNAENLKKSGSKYDQGKPDRQQLKGSGAERNKPYRGSERSTAELARSSLPDTQDEDEDSVENLNFTIPHYTKINGWDKSNKHVKELGSLLTSRKAEQNILILEGTRLINDALGTGVQPFMLVFSRVKLLKEINIQAVGKDCEFYHVPYDNIKMWSDLKTPTGVMAAFHKEDILNLRASSPLPITLICDNIRSPENLGATLRVAAGAGVERIVLMRGCVDPWSSKVLRAAAGAHFLVPIIEKVGWDAIKNHIPKFPQVLLADLVHQHDTSTDESEKENRLSELEARGLEEGYQANPSLEEGMESDLSYLDGELTRLYRGIPVDTQPYSSFTPNPGCTHTVVVVGGETEGVSDAAYKFCHDFNGSRLFVPLRNNVNSLNVISASSIVLFKVQQSCLQQQQQL